MKYLNLQLLADVVQDSYRTVHRVAERVHHLSILFFDAKVLFERTDLAGGEA